MRKYELTPAEFARIELLLASMIHFHHQVRSEEELRQFSGRIFPLLREVYYQILGEKIDDQQHAAISEVDPWDRPDDEAISLLTRIFR